MRGQEGAPGGEGLLARKPGKGPVSADVPVVLVRGRRGVRRGVGLPPLGCLWVYSGINGNKPDLQQPHLEVGFWNIP